MFTKTKPEFFAIQFEPMTELNQQIGYIAVFLLRGKCILMYHFKQN